MQLQSLGLRSELSLIDGETIDRNSYLVVRSPEEPGYYWGNLLVFAAPPSPEEFASWQASFVEEFADLPKVTHQTFTWDLTQSNWDPAPFERLGYRHEQTVVLTASELTPPPHPNSTIEIRDVLTQSEWQQVIELQVATRDSEHSAASYRHFIRSRLAGLRRRIEKGQGQWYAAFRGGEMLACLGIFRSGRQARFQWVVTAEAWRRQGICANLVHRVAALTLADEEVDTLVMLADATYHAARIYESVGFRPTERLEGLCRWPDSPIGSESDRLTP